MNIQEFLLLNAKENVVGSNLSIFDIRKMSESRAKFTVDMLSEISDSSQEELSILIEIVDQIEREIVENEKAIIQLLNDELAKIKYASVRRLINSEKDILMSPISSDGLVMVENIGYMVI